MPVDPSDPTKTRILDAGAQLPRSNGIRIAPPSSENPDSLLDSCDQLFSQSEVEWVSQYRLRKILGAGGQGVVYLADHVGANEITFPVALKVFSPKRYKTNELYRADMTRLGRVLARTAVVQQDRLTDVHNFIECDGVYVMVMEWIDGFDLGHLLSPGTLGRTSDRVSDQHWTYLTKVVFSPGPARVRLKPGIANSIVRECLAALGAMHRAGIVHADIKPSNIMVKRTGNTKLIDYGAAFEADSRDQRVPVTPGYAAPEVLQGEPATSLSDLASLGYVLIEMLSGVRLFEGLRTYEDLLSAKQRIVNQVFELLPHEILASELLLELICGLVAPDPRDRFPNAEAADLFEHGAAKFNRQLVLGNLGSEYEADLRTWLTFVE